MTEFTSQGLPAKTSTKDFFFICYHCFNADLVTAANIDVFFVLQINPFYILKQKCSANVTETSFCYMF